MDEKTPSKIPILHVESSKLSPIVGNPKYTNANLLLHNQGKNAFTYRGIQFTRLNTREIKQEQLNIHTTSKFGHPVSKNSKQFQAIEGSIRGYMDHGDPVIVDLSSSKSQEMHTKMQHTTAKTLSTKQTSQLATSVSVSHAVHQKISNVKYVKSSESNIQNKVLPSPDPQNTHLKTQHTFALSQNTVITTQASQKIKNGGQQNTGCVNLVQMVDVNQVQMVDVNQEQMVDVNQVKKVLDFNGSVQSIPEKPQIIKCNLDDSMKEKLITQQMPQRPQQGSIAQKKDENEILTKIETKLDELTLMVKADLKVNAGTHRMTKDIAKSVNKYSKKDLNDKIPYKFPLESTEAIKELEAWVNTKVTNMDEKSNYDIFVSLFVFSQFISNFNIFFYF